MCFILGFMTPDSNHTSLNYQKGSATGKQQTTLRDVGSQEHQGEVYRSYLIIQSYSLHESIKLRWF